MDASTITRIVCDKAKLATVSRATDGGQCWTNGRVVLIFKHGHSRLADTTIHIRNLARHA